MRNNMVNGVFVFPGHGYLTLYNYFLVLSIFLQIS